MIENDKTILAQVFQRKFNWIEGISKGWIATLLGTFNMLPPTNRPVCGIRTRCRGMDVAPAPAPRPAAPPSDFTAPDSKIGQSALLQKLLSQWYKPGFFFDTQIIIFYIYRKILYGTIRVLPETQTGFAQNWIFREAKNWIFVPQNCIFSRKMHFHPTTAYYLS